MSKIKSLFLSTCLLLSCHALCQHSKNVDTISTPLLTRYFKYIHYEKQIATYDSLDWCNKVAYFEEVNNLPKRKKKKIDDWFIVYMLDKLMEKARYSSAEKTALGYCYTSKSLKHDIAVWRKILNCE